MVKYLDFNSTVLVRCVFVGNECLRMCGVSGDRCLGFSVVRWLFGGSMVGLLAVLFVPLLSLLAMPGHCRILRNTCTQRL